MNISDEGSLCDLNIAELNDKTIAVQLCFFSRTSTLSFESLGITNIKYIITVHNISQDKKIKFQTTRPASKYENFRLSSDAIPGNPDDYFDIQVTVLRATKQNEEAGRITDVPLRYPVKLLKHKKLHDKNLTGEQYLFAQFCSTRRNLKVQYSFMKGKTKLMACI